MEMIKSKDNPKVKRLALLHDRKKAIKEGVVFIEGTRLCEDALKSGIKPEMIAFTSNREAWVNNVVDTYELCTELVLMSDECFAKIASTVNPQGVAMITKAPDLSGDIPSRDDGKDIYVVLEALQDPGNMGTIIRLADAFDFTAIIMTSGTVDPFNEKVLRASMGSVWHIPMRKVDDIHSVFDFCKEKGVSTLAMHLKGNELSDADISLPCCYFIGNEGNGLTDECTNMCDTMVKIPMAGKAESLNAASAASIIGYILSTKR